mgnify:CR=1 FL=1
MDDSEQLATPHPPAQPQRPLLGLTILVVEDSRYASEAMRLLERGYRVQKFFPAEAAGGAKALKSLASPIPQILFCPTGGVTPDNAGDYLSLPNTACVGGSWVAPKDKVIGGDWAGIEDLARAATGLG